MHKNDAFAAKRAWVRANRGILSRIAVDAQCGRTWVFQVLYYGHPTKDGLVEKLLKKAGAPYMEERGRGAK